MDVRFYVFQPILRITSGLWIYYCRSLATVDIFSLYEINEKILKTCKTLYLIVLCPNSNYWYTIIKICSENLLTEADVMHN